MNTNSKKRVAFAVLALVFFLSACKKDEAVFQNKKLSTDYEATSLSADFGETTFSDMTVCSPFAMLLHRPENEAEPFELHLYELNSQKVEHVVRFQEKKTIVDYVMDNNDIIYILTLSENADREIAYYLKGYNFNSELVLDFKLPIIQTPDIARSILVTDELLYVQFKSAYAEVDFGSGELLELNELKGDINLAKTLDGQVVLGESIGEEYRITYLHNGGERIIGGSFSGISNGGGKYDLLVSDGNGIYGLLLDGGETSLLLNYKMHGMSSDGNFAVLSDEKILTIYDGAATILVPTEKETVVLTMATYGENIPLVEAVNAFNKGGIAKIALTDYSNYDTVKGNGSGINLLKTEIIAGKIPDIIDLSVIPYYDAAALGLLEDLTPLFAQQPNLENEYLKNVLTCYSENGKIYNLLPSFIISTVIKEKSDGDGGWTVEEFLEFAKQQESPEKVFGNKLTQAEFIEYVLAINGSEYVDYGKGTCDFINTDFHELLAFAKGLPAVPADNDLYSMTMFYTGNSKCLLTAITGIESLINKKPLCREGYEYKGFPVSDRQMGAIVPIINLGMSSKSDNKAEMQAFFEYLLSEEYQKSLLMSIPVNRNALEERIKKDIKISEKTKKSVFLIGEEEHEINTMPLDDSDAKRFLAMVESLNKPLYHNEALYQIVMEEASAFFAGQKTAEETAKLIQSRVSIYVAEQG